MSCPCDRFAHPQRLRIDAGLHRIPRQIARFPEFRRAMLASLRDHDALAGWRAREGDDPGVMLLEMWAYVCDVLAFYDEVIAHEAYLRTARRRPSLRKLVGLLGYVPRPAVAASVVLAVLAEGRQPVTLPPGAGFRSGAFDGEPPQVFEVDVQTRVHPLINRFTLEQPRPATIGGAVPLPPKGHPQVLGVGTQTSVHPLINRFTLERPWPAVIGGRLPWLPWHRTDHLLFEPASAKVKQGDLVVISAGVSHSWTAVRTVASTTLIVGEDGAEYVKVVFNNALVLPCNAVPAQVSILKSSQQASLWTLSGGRNQAPVGSDWLRLDGLYRQIKPGNVIVLALDDQFDWFRVVGNHEVIMKLAPTGSATVTDSNDNTSEITPPPTPVPVTQLTVDARGAVLTAYEAAKARTVVHYGFVEAGIVTVQARNTIGTSDELRTVRPLDVPVDHEPPARFLLEDKNGTGVEVDGSLDFGTGVLTLNPGTRWDVPLVCPVEVYANAVAATRGETVAGEILGSGDASVASQTFKLKKKPLTYISSPTADNERGVVSTLEIHVDGIRWEEVPTFFDIKHDARVYIVREDDEGACSITFGDGVHGARLPTGTDNVVADYRYGAGAATPPAGSITQLSKPVKGVQAVRNPVRAFGGDDAESADEVRSHAPEAALILGRAVSIRDFEAVTAGLPGVRAVRAEWRWHEARQRPVARIWYIGAADLAESITTSLRNLADPALALGVDPALPRTLRLSLDVEIDPRYQETKVLNGVRDALMNSKTGLLAPERIGIGCLLYRSRLFATVLAVDGALAVRDIQCDGVSFTEAALDPGAGRYFDLEAGALVLNGREDSGA